MRSALFFALLLAFVSIGFADGPRRGPDAPLDEEAMSLASPGIVVEGDGIPGEYWITPANPDDRPRPLRKTPYTQAEIEAVRRGEYPPSIFEPIVRRVPMTRTTPSASPASYPDVSNRRASRSCPNCPGGNCPLPQSRTSHVRYFMPFRF